MWSKMFFSRFKIQYIPLKAIKNFDSFDSFGLLYEIGLGVKQNFRE